MDSVMSLGMSKRVLSEALEELKDDLLHDWKYFYKEFNLQELIFYYALNPIKYIIHIKLEILTANIL